MLETHSVSLTQFSEHTTKDSMWGNDAESG